MKIRPLCVALMALVLAVALLPGCAKAPPQELKPLNDAETGTDR